MTLFSRRRFIGLAAGSALLVATSAQAHERHGDEATPDASPIGTQNTGTGAVYLTITNRGASPERLISAKSEAAQSVEIHTMKLEGGVMTMSELVDGLDIPGGETLTLDPDNLHLMLVNLNHDLTPGSMFDVELTFDTLGVVTVTAIVGIEAPTDQPPVDFGEIQISNVWSRPAHRLTPAATPAG